MFALFALIVKSILPSAVAIPVIEQFDPSSFAELVLKNVYNQVAEAAYQEFQTDYKNYQQENNITESNEDKNN